VAVAVVGLVAAACTPPTNPPVDSPGLIANVVPASGTPNFDGPTPPPGGFGTNVSAVAQVGNFMVAGGNFTLVNGASRPFLAAWGNPNGAVDTSFPATTVNKSVMAIEPTAGRTGFYAAGLFTTASGLTTNVALYSLQLNKIITSFKVTADGTINTMALVGKHLLLGGYFSHIDGQVRLGLASVNYATGAVEPYFNINLHGHHNFGKPGAKIDGQVGAISMAVSPDGSRVVVIGNFTAVTDPINFKTGYQRDQIVNIDLSPTVPFVDTNWATATFTNPCDKTSFDSYVQNVAWSPDGSFFVVVDSGGYTGGSFQACDSATRFNASQTGLRIPAVWTDFTGKDSLYSVAVTTSAVYVGGHNRWMNNPLGNDDAKAGAVARPGLAALDPANGEPLAWNPGRNPRGHGADVIYGTKTGVWVGSDTNCIGPGNAINCTGPGVYEHDELAFFPYAGGTAPAGNATGAATKIFKAGSWASPSVTTLSASNFNPANGAGGPTTAPNSGAINWSQVRGAFMLNGRIYYGYSDGKFYFATFNGSTFGTPTVIDPYDDPTWDSVLTGSPTGSTNTYQGVSSGFNAEIPNITGMFYANRSIYYTLAGDKRLFRRAFSPGTAASSNPGQATGGVISPVRITVVDVNGLMNFTNAGGMWLANGKLYVASRSGGALYSMAWSGTTVSSHPVHDTAAAGSWSGRGVFIAQ
jgi:hypothetical protein